VNAGTDRHDLVLRSGAAGDGSRRTFQHAEAAPPEAPFETPAPLALQDEVRDNVGGAQRDAPVDAVADRVRAAAARVVDPEVPVLTIDDLGILHDVAIDEAGRVTVTILPTYSGCPAMGVIALGVETELAKDGFEDVKVRLANAPAWSTDRMSEAARAKLRAYGISPPERVSGKRALFAASAGVDCPRCGASDTERISEFGSTACKALWRCCACREPFDHFKCI
jgi:ring-1,2-phenylacetyl-CoA epoxidase subunit PaaD